MKNCNECKYLKILPPICSVPCICKLGAEKIPHWTERSFKVAIDCPLKKENK